MDQVPEMAASIRNFMLVLAGPCADESYGGLLRRRIAELGVDDAVLSQAACRPATRGWRACSQLAGLAVLPSVSETFGLVLLEAWAAGAAVMASRTSGATAFIRHGENGWLFDLERPESFHEAAAVALNGSGLRERFAASGRAMVQAQYDVPVIARHTRQLYYQLIEAKSCGT